MKSNFLLILFFISIWGNAQKKESALKISYETFSNGKPTNSEPILVFTDANQTILTNASIISKKTSYPFELSIINRPHWDTKSWSQLNEKQAIETVDSFQIANQKFTFSDEQKIILGYTCHKAVSIINSNTLEVWYTKSSGYWGSPTLLGQKLGLVLEITRNGNFTIKAKSIEKIKQMPQEALPPKVSTKPVNTLTYKDLIWKARFKTISVFQNEQICFSETSKSNDSILKFANGTVIIRKIKFPEIKKGSQLFAELITQSNGDAYDRTGSVFVIPEDKKISFLDGMKFGVNELPKYENNNSKKYQGVVANSDFTPLVEIMRFFTPFGINHYNYIQLKDKTWHDKVNYRQDLSDLNDYVSNKELWVGVFIGNYDKGGHKVTLDFTIHNGEENEIKTNQYIPLFNTTNVLEMAGQEYGTLFDSEEGLKVAFTIEKPLKNVRLRYITTGHGGWSNGDEFVPKKNTVLLNNDIVFSFTPWRTDCGSYRLYNPASGNFSNGLSSSDYSRSNWCPGTVTYPIDIDLGDLPIGHHLIQIKIPQGKPEGGSFSSWNISGILIGTE
jgi:hypothetical protein